MISLNGIAILVLPVLKAITVVNRIRSVAAKKGDVSVPFRPIQAEVKWPFHAQKMETGRDGTEAGDRQATENAVNYSNCS